MQQALGLILSIYVLPLILIFAATISSGGFETDVPVLPVAGALSQAYLRQLREVIANLLVPLVIAHTVSLQGTRDTMPSESRRLLYLLSAMFVFSAVLNGIVVAREHEIGQSDKKAVEAFTLITMAYAKETLIYVSLLIGSLRFYNGKPDVPCKLATDSGRATDGTMPF